MKLIKTSLVLSLSSALFMAGAFASGTTTTTHHTTSSIAIGDMVDINTASIETLQALPGINATKARAIIAARPFTTTKDLLKVKGVKQSTYKKIENNIRVN